MTGKNPVSDLNVLILEILLLNTAHEPNGRLEGSSELVILAPIPIAQSTLSL